MKINELEKELNISRANIRFYEKEGLLSPLRKENGYREYSEQDISLLKKIIVYRKLGISISDIQDIFAEKLSLQDAIDRSISKMGDEISRLKVSTEICREIKDKNIDDKHFDEEFYWTEINSREAKGEEFIDISSTDKDGKKPINYLMVVFFILCFLGIMQMLITANLITDNNQNYEKKQNEIKTFNTISYVIPDSENRLLYVCYNEATCVNVYDYEGNFQWAVSVPSNPKTNDVIIFYIEEGKLTIKTTFYDYVYDSVTGQFIEKNDAKNYTIPETEYIDGFFSQEQDYDNNVRSQGFGYDGFDVFKTAPDGDAEYYIVNMPEWYFLIAPEFGLLIVILCGIALVGLTVLSMYLSYKNLPLNMDEVGLQAKIMTWILRIVFAIICAYGLINAVMGFIKRETFIGLIPLTAFAALIIIVSGILSRWYNRSEKKYCGRWRLYNIIAYFSIFLLHVISVLDLTP